VGVQPTGTFATDWGLTNPLKTLHLQVLSRNQLQQFQ